ncbi:hypothetical protein PENTCL1PPCAC_4453 [Pristionchus entomophagus]|uniref:Uncharacterized protein n=1 Tax=Pristionchus entomophagus TaxID=358040 RepID=A0AAV5SGV5_9BILA|nr:hypothetical protein PENTCL1PPCAC_4453 [Pristionchus entomophagus]
MVGGMCAGAGRVTYDQLSIGGGGRVTSLVENIDPSSARWDREGACNRAYGRSEDETAWIPRMTLVRLFLGGATVLAQLLVGASIPAALGRDSRRVRAYGIELLSGWSVVLVVAHDGQRLGQTSSAQSLALNRRDEGGEEEQEEEGSGSGGGGGGRHLRATHDCQSKPSRGERRGKGAGGGERGEEGRG